MPSPSDIIHIFSNIYARTNIASNVVDITGIYRQNPNGRCYNGYYYDIIADVNSNYYIKILLSDKIF